MKKTEPPLGLSHFTQRQRIAFCNPCRFASERKLKLYQRRIQLNTFTVETILTLNLFRGVPEWQMSARFLLNERAVNLFVKVPRAAVEEVVGIIKAELGAGSIRQINSVLMLNYFKTASDAERRDLRLMGLGRQS